MDERSKKFTILILIILILLLIVVIIGGIFWWWNSLPLYPPSVMGDYPSEEEFVIKDTLTGKVVENEKAGLRAEVPRGWEAEKVNVGWPTDEWIINLLSPDAELVEGTPFLKRGCGISIIVVYSEENSEKLRKFIKKIRLWCIFQPKTCKEYQKENHIEGLLEVDGLPALKESLFDNQTIGKGIAVKVPFDNKIFVFDTLLVPGYRERCSQEFNSFLKTILID